MGMSNFSQTSSHIKVNKTSRILKLLICVSGCFLDQVPTVYFSVDTLRALHYVLLHAKSLKSTSELRNLPKVIK